MERGERRQALFLATGKRCTFINRENLGGTLEGMKENDFP